MTPSAQSRRARASNGLMSRVHIRASGHELIGGAVQHQDDALRLEASGAFFEAQVDGGGEAAHAADLQVDEHQFG